MLTKEVIPNSFNSSNFSNYNLIIIKGNRDCIKVVTAIKTILGYDANRAWDICDKCNNEGEAILITTNLYYAEVCQEQFNSYIIPTRIDEV